MDAGGAGVGGGGVRPPAALELLRGAVAIASPSGGEERVAAYLVEAMARICERAFIDPAGNAVGVWGRGPLRATFLGHIDTVPGEVPVRIEGGALWGRGSVDAKGAFCTAIAAAARLPDALRERLTLQLIGAVEEEAPSSAGARYALEAYPAPDLLIVGEPSGWDAVTLGYKGRLVAKLAVAVANFHSAGEGTTAAEHLVRAWCDLKRWSERASERPEGGTAGIFDAVQATLQRIATRSDGLRQRGTATVGFRLPPAWPPERVEPVLRELLREPVTLELVGAERPYRGPRDTPLTRAFRVAIRAAGGRPRTKVKTGTSDMNVVAPVWDVPMLAYGPGDSAFDHAPDERLELAELERAVAVLSGALEHLAR